jgi:hypothetical protein
MPATRKIWYTAGSVASTTLAVANTTTFMAAATMAAGDLTGLAAGEIPVGGATELDLDVTISAISGGSASLIVTVDRKGADGVWYNIFTSSALIATGATSTTIDAAGGATNKGFANIVRVGFFVSNTTTPSVTLSASLIAKS